MEMKPPGASELIAYLVHICNGHQDSATLLGYFLAAVHSMATGASVPKSPLEGARFEAAHHNLQRLGIAKFSRERQQFEVDTDKIMADFIQWYIGGSGQIVH